MHLKRPLMIPGLNLKEERRKGKGKKGRREGEEWRRGRKKGRDRGRHQLTKSSYSSPCLQFTPTHHPTSQCSHTELFSVSPFRSLLNCHLLTKTTPNPTGFRWAPFNAPMAFITDICRVFNNCPFAYLSPNLGICPRMSGSISIMFLVTSPGPGLKPDTWQRPPKDVSNECMNDLEIRKKKGKDGDARYLLPWRTSGD